MANTFKVKSNAAMPASAATPLTLFTADTTTVCIGLMLANVHTAAVTATVKVESDTSDTETNETVFVLKDAPNPVGGSLEVLAGNKLVMQNTDVMKIDCSVSAKIDATLSIMEIS